MLFFTNNAFAGGTEVSRQNNMILFSNDNILKFHFSQIERLYKQKD